MAEIRDHLNQGSSASGTRRDARSRQCASRYRSVTIGIDGGEIPEHLREIARPVFGDSFVRCLGSELLRQQARLVFERSGFGISQS
jgi:hypothetical protein